MEAQLCTDRMDGQDTATGLLTPVLQRPSSIQGCKRGKYIILGGDRFPGDRMGGTCLERAIGGGWPLTETRHINLLELRAVVRLLQYCKPLLQGKHVLVRSDNRTTEAYINRQDGVSSAALFSAAENLWLWASENVFISKGPPYWRTGGPASCQEANGGSPWLGRTIHPWGWTRLHTSHGQDSCSTPFHRRCNRGVTHSGPTSPGLAPERDRLRQGGLSDSYSVYPGS